jgi:hypothetical protein
MPLIKSGSREAISTNIREMMAAGHPQKQAIAAAMSTARRYARGGYADGGAPVAAGWLPPDDAALSRYPDNEDVNFARQYGHFDRDPRSEYLNNQKVRLLTGDIGNWYNGRGKLPAQEFDLRKQQMPGQNLKQIMTDYYARAGLASKRSALATLGFDPSTVAADVTHTQDKPLTLTDGRKQWGLFGATGRPPQNEEIYANAQNPPTLVHESIHRGVDRLRGTPFWKKEFDQYDGDKNYNNNEMVPRYLMATRMGDPEKHNPVQRAASISHFEGLGGERNKRILDDMEMAASRYMASRNPRGPRATGGRADKLPISVGGGAYVLPADHVAALGQNNSMAGGNILDSMFKMGHFGAPRSTSPRMPRFGMRRKMFADGGAPDQGRPVKIIAAGGEYVVPPEVVAELGGGDLDHGHAILDQWVKTTRRKHIKTLRGLKPPKQS